MGKETGISWTDHTFNPWWGCVRVSPGCKHCYAADLAGRYGQGWTPTSERRFMTAAWNEPPKWNRAAQAAGKPAFVFCASMADIFEDVPEHVREQTEAARVRLWALIDATPWLVWLLLTKRPERVAQVVPPSWMAGAWPSNVWIGCTIEDTQHAGERLPHLMALPAARRFVSYEPALGPVAWGLWLQPSYLQLAHIHGKWMHPINWLIIGGESGSKARPFRAEWARDTIRQCRAAGVPAWMKQLGDKADVPKSAHHGADPSEWPDDLRVQRRPDPLPVG